MFCPKCGTELPDHAKFCHKCGEKTGDHVITDPQNEQLRSDVPKQIPVQPAKFDPASIFIPETAQYVPMPVNYPAPVVGITQRNTFKRLKKAIIFLAASALFCFLLGEALFLYLHFNPSKYITYIISYFTTGFRFFALASLLVFCITSPKTSPLLIIIPVILFFTIVPAFIDEYLFYKSFFFIPYYLNTINIIAEIVFILLTVFIILTFTGIIPRKAGNVFMIVFTSLLTVKYIYSLVTLFIYQIKYQFDYDSLYYLYEVFIYLSSFLFLAALLIYLITVPRKEKKIQA